MPLASSASPRRPPKSSEVVLDTNFCLIPVRRKRDVFSELRAMGFTLVILPAVIAELESLAEKGTGTSITAREARATLQMLERKGLKTARGSGSYADTAILAYCQSRGAAAATHDNELRSRLRNVGVAVVTLGRSGALRTEGVR